MRRDEFELVQGCLAETLGELRAEYVERLVTAAKAGEPLLRIDATRIAVLDDVVGELSARAASIVPERAGDDDE